MYHVIDIARHSETEEEFVVYRAMYGEMGLWIRPLRMFIEVVDNTQPRFEYVGEIE